MSGRLAGLNIPAATETALYAPGVTTRASVKVIFANRNAGTSARVRIILRPAAGPTVVEDYLAFDEVLPVAESRVSAVFDMENPQELRVESDVAGVTAQANGIERDV